ncbi:MAG: hypothetical protein M0Z59_04175 [Nitrospiraceae bacterium]|nr:hypothetical protein [Nitrospiraceae bacterium]
MCIDHKITCVCGRSSASFNFKDEVMPSEVVSRLYCPGCSGDVKFDPRTMLRDNGWIIEFDMDVAGFFASGKLPRVTVTPEFIFDEGYCTWRGVYPADHIDSVNERRELLELLKTDRKRYFEEFRDWGTKRMARLAAAGWRKANAV